METTAAKNYLENTNLKFKFKAGAAIGTAAYLLILVLIEEIAGIVLPSFWGDTICIIRCCYCSNCRWFCTRSTACISIYSNGIGCTQFI